MDPDFWHERWRSNRIAFHNDEVNPVLETNLSRLRLEPGARVFVPLCGKSLDMLWLCRQGFRVLGVEISPIAVRAFFEENGLGYREQRQGPFTSLEGDTVHLLCGDFFDLRPVDVAEVSGVYDRASLIALLPAQRQNYARHLLHLLPRRLPVLLVTLEYPQHEMNGPPFSVGEAEVRELFGGAYDVQVLCVRDALHTEARFRERLTRLTERGYLLANAGGG
ncbi:MAG: thiopurine S-methyltransferase [Gammaproteobacteria bacterium]|nr:thiopurine S-methyltransferase [Gammaproteobacteria bacterium]NIR83639.1 thiopurine S-methyltransferase [Gammaproteobacteria bacterium]NIR91612.1 thiopurine S-methyltransferase [Gammaproteobacteria bacterium]NIU04801.1 thiopurine S-methyltransferase [Gammaproteobacteria bacterium]NIV53151.1 thiopurine S-methyltransferase [Gammaproteobacteria bacterium]